MFWYSLEAPLWGASNEYPQHMFTYWNKKDTDLDTPLVQSYTKWQYTTSLVGHYNSVINGASEVLIETNSDRYVFGEIRESIE